MKSLPVMLCGGLLFLLIGCSENKPPPQPVSLDNLPQSVKDGFARDFPHVEIQRVERIPQKTGPDFYRLHYIGADGQQQEILYNPEGYRDTRDYQRQETSPQ